MTPAYLTITQASIYTGMSRSLLKKLVRSEELTLYKFPKVKIKFFKRVELDHKYEPVKRIG